MSDPLYIDRAGHRTWLKWHRARRTKSDPVFTGRRILEAMRLGASVEVDLVIHGDHGCAILHNFELGEETTGTGLVRATSAATLRELQLCDNEGRPIAEHVMLLEDLCALLMQHEPHPDALLQLDFKEEFSALDAQTVANFGHAVGPVARHMIISGGDATACRALAEAAPGLRLGYDPCYGESIARLEATGDFATFIADALATAPDAELIYLDYTLVLAAEARGFDIIAPVHAASRRVDAWTIRTVDAVTLPQVERLLALKVDQITTDDPEALAKALSS